MSLRNAISLSRSWCFYLSTTCAGRACNGRVDALIREIREEIGVTPVVGEFAGAIEHTWSDAGTDQHELNLVFRMELSAVNPAGNPASREKHLEFFWLDIEDLGKHNLLPAPMIDIVREANNHSKGFWASTIGD